MASQTLSSGTPPNNPFGAHLLVGSIPAIDQHLDWALHLVGPRGYVKNLFTGIDQDIPGPKAEWVHFVEQAYRRGLIPVCRLAGHFNGSFWEKPAADQPLDYFSMAAAVKRVVAGLPLHDDLPLYVEVWNEPHLPIEWSMAPSPEEYAHFLVQVSAALRSLGRGNLHVLNAGLSPLQAMGAALPESLDAFDILASHPYPHNHPPQVNLHAGTAGAGSEFAIDSYQTELRVLERYGRPEKPVMLTETGYHLGNRLFKDYPVIDELNRGRYMVEAFRDHWLRWPEVRAVIPFQLSTGGQWSAFDWVDPEGGSDSQGRPLRPTLQYRYVAALGKPTEDLGSVSGRVLSSASGAPIAGAAVSFTDGGETFMTGADGFFILGDKPLGTHRIAAKHADFLGLEKEMNLSRSDQNLAVDFPLEHRHALLLSGRVDGDDGRPLPGVSIQVEPGAAEAKSGADGDFSLSLPPGVYQVELRKQGHATIKKQVGLPMQGALSLQMARLPLAEDANLLVNSNFEEGFGAGLALGWQSRDGKSHPESFFPKAGVMVSGQLSQGLRLGSGVSLFEQWTPYTALHPGRRYRLSAWIRLEGLEGEPQASGSTQVRVLAVFMTNESQAVGLMTAEPAETRPGGWQRWTVDAVAPAGAQRAMIEIGSSTPEGVMLADDVYFGSL